jgi:hypothetical protein
VFSNDTLGVMCCSSLKTGVLSGNLALSLYVYTAGSGVALRGPSLRVLSIAGVQFIGSERIPVFRQSAAVGCCRR